MKDSDDRTALHYTVGTTLFGYYQNLELVKTLVNVNANINIQDIEVIGICSSKELLCHDMYLILNFTQLTPISLTVNKTKSTLLSFHKTLKVNKIFWFNHQSGYQ